MTRITTVTPEDGEHVVAPNSPANRPMWQRIGMIALPVALAGAGFAYHSRKTAAVEAPALQTVTVASPVVRSVTQWDDYVGRFEASKMVAVRPRVSGAIDAVRFTDGAIVQKGQLLFTIDPRPYAAALAEARASAASASSDLALARANLDRANRLLSDDAVSKSDLDQLHARVRAATASLSAAQARVQSRQLDMEFTQVRAPITGRISDRKVDPGNLVSASDGGGTLLTSINALDPIYFTFDSSEALYLKAQRTRTGGGQDVEIKLQDEADYGHKGRVDFTDNGLNAQSGTIRGRAVVDNPGYFLSPGMFGNMRLSQGGKAQALLVPDAAVRTDQARKVVFVVTTDGTVAAKPVATGPLVGRLRVIRSGLTRNDRVVIQGIQFATPGARVTPRPGKIDMAMPGIPASMTPDNLPAAAQATLAD